MRRAFGILTGFVLFWSAACSVLSGSTATPRLSDACGESSCVRVLPVLDADGAPLNGATILIPFDRPVKIGRSSEMAVVNAAVNLETRQQELTFSGVKSLRVDPRAPAQVRIEVETFLADGSGIAFGDGVLVDEKGKPFGPLEIKLKTPWSPLTVALANTVWEPADPSLFKSDGLKQPKGATAEAAVRSELEARLRIRPGISDTQVQAVLNRFDSETTKKKAPHARVRGGLMLLTGTSGEYAIDFLLADTNRRGVPFEPIKVEDLSGLGAYAAVSYQPLEGKLRMYVDTLVAADSLDVIAVALAHEAVHSDLGGGSVAEEILAMASDTRVYQELLLFDPTIALAPTDITRASNSLTLALRNSGRWAYPRAGVLPRPGVDDVLRGTGDEPARSFKDLLFKPDYYGDYNPKAGDAGTEVIEQYYRRISGNTGDAGRLKYDQHTLKLYDQALDNGFTDEQIWRIADALKLKPVKIK